MNDESVINSDMLNISFGTIKDKVVEKRYGVGAFIIHNFWYFIFLGVSLIVGLFMWGIADSLWLQQQDIWTLQGVSELELHIVACILPIVMFFSSFVMILLHSLSIGKIVKYKELIL